MFIHRGKDIVHGTDHMSGLLFDMAKHLSNLKFTVWEKMLDDIDYSEFTWLLCTFSSVVEVVQTNIWPMIHFLDLFPVF